ncbi:MAG: hypothetical protein DMF90_13660 [Acidobacteria bacterium]|nr:MAG: hypothetical protein DMF90_13660 [Acidobacteriota bacterium]
MITDSTHRDHPGRPLRVPGSGAGASFYHRRFDRARFGGEGDGAVPIQELLSFFIARYRNGARFDTTATVIGTDRSQYCGPGAAPSGNAVLKTVLLVR